MQRLAPAERAAGGEMNEAAAAPASVPGPGTVLVGKYRVDRVLGTGGMAVVLAATHLELREPVAIKVLRRHILGRPGALERFRREARVAMRLRSAHVVRVYDISATEDGTPFIVMDLLQGADFATLLDDRGPFPLAAAADHLLQACQALAEAHAAGVVHRDLKPANLFLCASIDGSPCVKVLDFGVSKLLMDDSADSAAMDLSPPSSKRHLIASPPSSRASPDFGSSTEPASSADQWGGRARVTLTHAFLGSPRYMAPEQIRSARDVDARADIWALGVILQELVTGAPPFVGGSLDELCECVLERHPAPLKLASGPDPALEAAIAGCLAKDPAERYQDVRTFAEAIVRFASADGKASFERIVRITQAKPTAGSASPPTPGQYAGHAPTLVSDRSEERIRPGGRRARTWAPIALALGGALGVGATVLAFTRPARLETERPTSTAPNAPSIGSAPPLSAAPAPSVPSATTTLAVDAAAPVTLPSAAQLAPPATVVKLHHSRAAAPRASASAPPDPLGLDTGSLFRERR